MKSIIFATNNEHKVSEIRSFLHEDWNIITLKEAGIFMDIPEPHFTLEENAREKSLTIFQLTGQDCFSEDTGLETDALNGAPGVFSARYAGEPSSSEANIEKLLNALKGIDNRKARFRTVISIYLGGQEFQFEGICNGTIAHEKMGGSGFGYDPIFIPDGAYTSFANMTSAEKNSYSHRKKAMEKLIQFLNKEM
jgi:XTP/dITP diphosphohydrolase